MKYIFYFLFLSQIAQAQQSRFKEGESIYVWALSGLNIRKLPDAKSEKIAALPYGTKVMVQANIGVIVAHEVEEFKDFKVKGVWVLVKYGDKEGFVFDGFMSRLVAPEKEDYGRTPILLDYYLKKNYQLITNINIDTEKLIGKYDHKYQEKPLFQKYNCGIVKRTKPASDGIFETTYEIPNATYYEGYILGKYCYFPEMESKFIKFTKTHDKIPYLSYYNPNDNCSFNVKKERNSIVISGACYC